MMSLSIFEDRVECTQPGLVGHGATDAVRYEQIAQVIVERGLKWNKLAIETTGGGGFGIAGLNKSDAASARVLINEHIDRARAKGSRQPDAAPVSMGDQIAQLASLRTPAR